MLTDYQAPKWAKNPHVQSFLATFKLRRPFLKRRAKALLSASQEVIIRTKDEHQQPVSLQGFYSPQIQVNDDQAPLAILIHGWEGSADSLYLLSAAQYLYAKGFSVFRLNLRDHGESHHLNQELFHSSRLVEVVNAVKYIQDQYHNPNLFLGGFSLGGNFSLRVAALAPDYGIDLKKVVAVCPPIDPNATMLRLHEGEWFYDWYFKRKWKKSLRKKRQLFPDMYANVDFESLNDLEKMTDLLISEFSDYPSTQVYFDSYALKGDCLKNLKVPASIVLAKDDPIIPHEGSELIHSTDALNIIKTEHGGHCGHMRNIRLHSWADEFIYHEFKQMLSQTAQLMFISTCG